MAKEKHGENQKTTKEKNGKTPNKHNLSLDVVKPNQIPEEKQKQLWKSLDIKKPKALKQTLMVVAKEKGKPIGYMSIVPQAKKNSMHIANTKVKKEKRGKGIGTKMNKIAENVAEELGIKEIHGQVGSKEAKEFWKERGFKVEKMGIAEEIKKKIPKPKSKVTSLLAEDISLSKEEKKKKKKNKRR